MDCIDDNTPSDGTLMQSTISKDKDKDKDSNMDHPPSKEALVRETALNNPIENTELHIGHITSDGTSLQDIALNGTGVNRRLFFGDFPAELPDELIVEALQILKMQFPDIGGLQTPHVGMTEIGYIVADSGKDTVEVVFDSERCHWVAVVILKLQGNRRSIFVYDSLLRKNGVGNLTDNLECKIAQMCHEAGPTITVVYPPCHQQDDNDKKSCGFFALAHAVEYCLTRKTRCPRFKVRSMQQHLADCLKWGKFKPFPKDPLLFKSPTSKQSIKELISVYCHCRMPQSYDKKTVECERCLEWFHFKCVGIEFSPGDWVCGRQECS